MSRQPVSPKAKIAIAAAAIVLTLAAATTFQLSDQRAVIIKASTIEIERSLGIRGNKVIAEDIDILGRRWTAGIMIDGRRYFLTGEFAWALGPIPLFNSASDLTVQEIVPLDP